MTLPFDELRQRSVVNKDAKAADDAPDPEFSQGVWHPADDCSLIFEAKKFDISSRNA